MEIYLYIEIRISYCPDLYITLLEQFVGYSAAIFKIHLDYREICTFYSVSSVC
jgi:hypothetical protein